MKLFFHILVLICSFGFSFWLSPKLIRFAHDKNFLDYPKDRKTHPKPIPYLGGTVIFISFWAVFLLTLFIINMTHGLFPFWDQVFKERFVYIQGKLISIFWGSFAIWLLGILDDRFDLSPALKFMVQLAAAGWLIHLGLSVNMFAKIPVLDFLGSLFWIVLIINAFNFIDSIDAHCAGISFIACMVFLAISLIVYQPVLSLVVTIMGGAILGFFPYNFRPARMFLGDNGSLFIGYMMAALTLLFSYRNTQYSIVTPFIPILMFGVPIYDTLSVIVVRTLRGIPPWKGDRNHFAHRLVRLGMSDRVAVTVSYFISFTLGLVAILSTQVYTFLGKILIMTLFVSVIGIIALLEYYASLRIRLMEKLTARHLRRKEDIQTAEKDKPVI